MNKQGEYDMCCFRCSNAGPRTTVGLAAPGLFYRLCLWSVLRALCRLTRSALSLLLAALLCHDLAAAAQADSDVATIAKALPIGAKMDLKLRDGSHFRGRLMSLDSDAIVVGVGQSATSTARRIPFSDVASLKAQKSRHTPLLAWIVTGAIITVVVVAVSVLLIERHNEGG